MMNSETEIRVTNANATPSKLHTWTIEASDLRLKPGEVPKQIATTLGNGRPFLLVIQLPDRFGYRQALGCLELIVFND